MAVETIIQNPHKQLIESVQLVKPSKAKYVEPKQVAKLASKLPYKAYGAIDNLFYGKSPELLPETTKQETLDVPENRFVKAFLSDLSNLCHELIGDLERANKRASLRQAKQWQAMVDEWLSWNLWREVADLSYVPSNSQVLQRRNGYREVLEAYITLQNDLQLPWERGLEMAECIGDIRPIYELYEYWC